MARVQHGDNTDASALKNVERLILSQAVYEHGSEAWPKVSIIMTEHPMLSRPESFFTAQTCSKIYLQLLEEAGLESSEANVIPKAHVNLRLAERHYRIRILELRELIAAEEAKFKTLVTEIDEIRGGLWDDKIRASLAMSPAEPEPEPEFPPAEEAQIEEAQAEEAQTEKPPSTAEQPMEVHISEEDDDDDDEQDHPEEAQVIVDLTEGTFGGEEEPDVETVDVSAESPPEQAVPVEVLPSEEQPSEAATSQEPTLVQEPEPLDVPEPTAAEPSAEEPDENAMEGVEEEVAEEPEVTYEDQSAAEADVQVQANDPREEDAIEEQYVPESTTLATEGDVPMDVDVDKQEVQAEGEATPVPEDESRTDAKRKASEEGTPLDAQRDKKRLREGSEATEEEPGPSTAPKGRRPGRPPAVDTPPVSKRFQTMITMVHSQISQHRYGTIFHNPIRKVEASDYHDIVKRPMDLKTIKARIKDGLISSSLEFQRDVYLMFANAMMYNRPGSEIYNMAEEMMLESEGHIQTFQQTEGFHGRFPM